MCFVVQIYPQDSQLIWTLSYVPWVSGIEGVHCNAIETMSMSVSYNLVCLTTSGRGGIAISLVTQYDIERLKNIEGHISKYMSCNNHRLTQ